jgi:D-aminopeptidase
LDEALAAARGDAIGEGNVGIGGGLQAFGLRGGVGTASRRAGSYLVGALLVANGGLPGGLSADGRALQEAQRAQLDEKPSALQDLPMGPQEFVAVVATDAPLLSFQLRSLAQRAALGAARCGLWNAYTRAGQVQAFSTEEAAAATETAEVLVQVSLLAEQELYGLFAAAAEAVEEAVLSALMAAETLNKNGQTLPALTQEAWAHRQGGK